MLFWVVRVVLLPVAATACSGVRNREIEDTSRASADGPRPDTTLVSRWQWWRLRVRRVGVGLVRVLRRAVG
jgi:hypothetical protein